jgi:hypothetical protein
MAPEQERGIGNHRTAAMVARSVGVVCIALGFVIGMHGLDHPDSSWLQTALGLIVTGLLAQGYALVSTLRRLREKNDPSRP